MKSSVTGIERHFDENDIIVSKTDLRGIITYANRIFIDVAGYTEAELLGQPHSIIRHPDMPACVFQLLWEVIKQGREIFAYVVNRAKNGDHYWVFAHVTPSFDLSGNHVGYHSNRRVPHRDAVEKASGLYAQLLDIEARYPDRKAGMAESRKVLDSLLIESGVTYDEFVFSLSTSTHFESSALAK